MPADPSNARDASALTPAEADRVAALVASTLAAPAPAERAREVIAELESGQQRPALAAAFFEALVYRVDLRNYWLYYRMWKIYEALGPARQDAAFLVGAMAVQMEPESSGSGQALGGLFRNLVRRGRDRDALDVFHHHMEHYPEDSAGTAEEAQKLLRRLDRSETRVAGAVAPGARRDHAVLAEDTRPGLSFRTFGGATPYTLRGISRPETRPAITVAELSDAEALVCPNSVLVTDRSGALHPDLCTTEVAEPIHRKFLRLEQREQDGVLHEADDAVLIADRFPVANICHMLFDHLTRLALYQRAGVDTGRALVIGPHVQINAQAEILRRAGVTTYLGVNRLARVRARRLWVSSNCLHVRHAAHLGAGWAVEFIRRTLGGRGTVGTRRIYLSRADASVRRVTNEPELIALLERHGFERIVPGEMPYDAQLEAFRQASDVIAPHGAGLTHLVLCPPGARVLEIFHPLYGMPSYAQQVPESGLRYAALLARDWLSDAPELNDPSLADVGGARYLDRHMRVPLAPVAEYLATLD